MKWISLLLVVISFVFGIVSAYYCYRAGKVPTSPAWEPEIGGDREKNMMAWVAGTMNAINKSGKLTRCAALYAALGVISSAIASIVALSQ